jgi:hypothetical protein
LQEFCDPAARNRHEIHYSRPDDAKLCILCILRSLRQKRPEIKRDSEILHIGMILMRLSVSQASIRAEVSTFCPKYPSHGHQTTTVIQFPSAPAAFPNMAPDSSDL